MNVAVCLGLSSAPGPFHLRISTSMHPTIEIIRGNKIMLKNCNGEGKENNRVGEGRTKVNSYSYLEDCLDRGWRDPELIEEALEWSAWDGDTWVHC